MIQIDTDFGECCRAFSGILLGKVCGEKLRGLNKSESKVFIALVSYRPAVSERTLPVKIPPNPCSVAADCAVPPGETLPEGLITGHPVCAEPRWLPRCLLYNGSVVLSAHQDFVHADVMPYTRERHL